MGTCLRMAGALSLRLLYVFMVGQGQLYLYLLCDKTFEELEFRFVEMSVTDRFEMM